MFACGEIVSGIHGANRIAGNSLADTQVFGYRAGYYSTRELLEENIEPNISRTDLKRYEREVFKRRDGENVFSLIKDLREIMYKNVGIVRDEYSLRRAYYEIEKLSKIPAKVHEGKIFNVSIAKFFEFKNMLLLARLIIKSSILRKESRGCFYRRDFPFERNEYRKRIFLISSSRFL